MSSAGTRPHDAPADDDSLEERLSRPDEGVLAALRDTPGGFVVLGAGGKMGPSITRMLRRGLDELGRADRVVAVSRFSSDAAATTLALAGVDVHRCDLSRREEVERLPDAANVLYMAGQKFGTREDPGLTWIANTVVPARAMERYAGSRVVAFSTGNVYPFTPASGRGSREHDTLAPVGEYAASCVGRERVLSHFARRDGTRVAIVRLNYAVDLRYGVLVDLARRVASGEPIDLRMGYVNVIWQGDANARAIRCFPLASVPPMILNVAGTEVLSVREVALRLGSLLGREPVLRGVEAPDALLSDASRSVELFGSPAVDADTLVAWVADRIQRGGRTVAKPTGFEVRDGGF